ncbi:MAG: methylated-DNA--[protein]-cysteine S-methyltransferase [Chloroflexota bacterium]|nr:methylated-DNA--[protein]-cysteine S-methyltransferase [Chloroflexota bacterium]
METVITVTDYQRIAEAIRYLEANFRQQPDLDQLAAHLGLSPFHLQRLFTRWAGISPKRFVQFLSAAYAKQLLAASHSVLDATYETGLSSPSRLHDLLLATEAVTPGAFKNKGSGLQICYARHQTPFGECLLAATERGICMLVFLDELNNWENAMAELRTRWQGATLLENAQATQPLVDQIFPPGPSRDQRPLTLFLQGTNFQVKVWEALLKIPQGAVASYEDVAQMMGQPNAARAVGSAVGANNIAYLIPCHRVIRKSGIIQEYRWGSTRKKAILGWEAARMAG